MNVKKTESSIIVKSASQISNKAKALDKIKKYVNGYQNADNPSDAEVALENAFALRDEHNIDYDIMTIKDYHMTLICSVLSIFYFGDLLCADLEIPETVSLDTLKNEDEIIISFTYVKTENGLDYELDLTQTKRITLVSSPKMDNLFKLREHIYTQVRESLNGVVKINIPELKLFIKRLNQDISNFSGGIRTIKCGLVISIM